MMGFIDDKDVPTGGQSLFNSLLVRFEEVDTAKHELAFQERVVSGIDLFDCLASFFVENVEPKIKTAQQFHEPLMNQRVGHEDQHALGAADEELAMQDQACFNGFSEADFIRKQNSR